MELGCSADVATCPPMKVALSPGSGSLGETNRLLSTWLCSGSFELLSRLKLRDAL